MRSCFPAWPHAGITTLAVAGYFGTIGEIIRSHFGIETLLLINAAALVAATRWPALEFGLN